MFDWLRPRRAAAPPLPDALWRGVVERFPFLAQPSAHDAARLRALAAAFLQVKRFHGGHGFAITDEVALSIAAQAVLPVLHLQREDAGPRAALRWYDDFVGIVVHADEVVARREQMDDSGVVHRWDEVLAGEAMEGGPVMLSWRDVAHGADTAQHGCNVVIHEFAHKIDMRDGAADGCPPLPPGFLGTRGGIGAARDAWFAVFEPAYLAFREQTILSERFGAPPAWLDAYGAEEPAEFFAVACEAYFVNRPRFALEHPALLALFDAFFRPADAAAAR